MRYQLVEYEQAEPDVQAIYDEVNDALGVEDPPNWVKCMGSNPKVLRGNWEKTKAVLLEGDIPHLLKELIIYVISTRRGAEYCAAAHAHSALSLDDSLTIEDLNSLAAGEAYEGMPSSFKAAIDVCERVALDPGGVSDEDFALLRDAGFNAEEIAEVLAQADLAVMFNTITSSLGLEIDAQYLNR